MNNKNYRIRIANRAPLTKNKTFPFSEESINNVPDINIFIEDNVNKVITKTCKDVLRLSMNAKNPYRYGEMGILASTDTTDKYGNTLPVIYEVFQGDYKKISVGRNSRYINAIANRYNNDLVFVHNHPDNSSFSGSDIMQLHVSQQLFAIVAIGNTHNIHVLTTSDNGKLIYDSIGSKTKNYSDEKIKKSIADMVATDVLKNPSKYNAEYFKIRRQNKR